MKRVYRILLILHTFVGIGAMGGGMMAILFPEGPAGMSADALEHSPFNDFLIPGIILFAVIGLGNVFSAVTLLKKSKYQGYVSSVFSWALVIWIIVQCIMLRAIVFLHVIYLILGLVEAMLSAIILFQQRLFPSNIVLKSIRSLESKYPKNRLIVTVSRIVGN